MIQFETCGIVKEGSNFNEYDGLQLFESAMC